MPASIENAKSNPCGHINECYFQRARNRLTLIKRGGKTASGDGPPSVISACVIRQRERLVGLKLARQYEPIKNAIKITMSSAHTALPRHSHSVSRPLIKPCIGGKRMLSGCCSTFREQK